MAHSPQTVDSDSLPALSKGQLAVLSALEQGETPADIAQRTFPDRKGGNAKRRSALQRKIHKNLAKPEMQAALMERLQTGMMAGLVTAGDGLAARASHRTDAAKFLFEVTGVHSPRSKVEHSGEVRIKLDLPRPTFAGQEAYDSPVLEEDPAE